MQKEYSGHQFAAGYHGLAAVAVAGVLLLMAISSLQLADTLQQHGFTGWPQSDRRLAAYGGYVGVALVELVSWLGLVLAVRGLVVARRTGESGSLCLAGLVLSLLAAAIWLMCGLAWHAQSAWLLR